MTEGSAPSLKNHPPSQALSRQLSPSYRTGRAKWAFAHLLLFLYRPQYFCMMIICALASPRVGERCHEVTERGCFCQKRRKREKRRGRHSPPCTPLPPCPAAGEGLAPPGRTGIPQNQRAANSKHDTNSPHTVFVGNAPAARAVGDAGPYKGAPHRPRAGAIGGCASSRIRRL